MIGAVRAGEAGGRILGTLSLAVAGALVGGLLAFAVGIGRIESVLDAGTWLAAFGAARLVMVLNAVRLGGGGAGPAIGGAG
jgi:hypothetical protein